MQSESTGISPPRLHRPFRFYDPEVIAILTILAGLFQLLLGIPTYILSSDIHLLYVCPVLVGALHLTGGSFAFVCERSPSRKWLKNCLYCTLSGLCGGLIATAVYSYAYQRILSTEICDHSRNYLELLHCPEEDYVDIFERLTALLSVYDVAGLILHALLSFSAIKGLKTN